MSEIKSQDLMTQIGIVLTGKQFNKKYKNVPMYRFTNHDEIHRNFEYKTGLNKDSIPFNSNKLSGGLYFGDVFHVGTWCFNMVWVREVTIPNDAKVFAGENMFKADKIVLGDKISIAHFYIPEEFCLEAVQVNDCAFDFVQNKTPEIISVVLNEYAWADFFIN